ncbi:MAG TPA: hypothetical protein VG204_14120 [Terriglobia bacterium]|nr:hypothetical protein [Terriglobia bacterium]
MADSGAEVLRRVDVSTGIMTIIAGSLFSAGFGGDGGPAINALLNAPSGVAVDSSGNIFVGDALNYRVRRIDAVTGTITTVAGNGTPGFSGDGGPATSASLVFGGPFPPARIAVDSSDNLFIVDTNNFRIRRVDVSTQIITTVAGNGSIFSSGDGGLATSAGVSFPLGVAVDAGGNLFIAETGGQRIREVNAVTKLISTIAGDGTLGFSGDGGVATSAALSQPQGVTVDSAGNVLIADTGNNRMRKVNTSQIITTIAGNGSVGDGGLATSATLFFPQAVAVDETENLYIADSSNDVVRRVDAASGVITNLAGIDDLFGFNGDGIPATTAQLSDPIALAVDGLGSVFIADPFNNRIRRVDGVTGIITTVAGNGTTGFSGDSGSATSASLALPSGVTLDNAGDLFIADEGNNRIRRVDAVTGIITTVAGNGVVGFSGDGGLATSAALNLGSPFTGTVGMAVDGSGNLFFTDVSNSRVRRVDAASGIITTVAGSSTACNPALLGDGGPATSASLCIPEGVVVDPAGILYISDNAYVVGYQRVRRVDAATRVITTIAGGLGGFRGDGGPATNAGFEFLRGLALSGTNSLFIADANGQRIRRVLLVSNVEVGLPAISGNGNCIPFGCPAQFGTTTYQQVYASNALPGVVNITGIDFLNTQLLNGAVPAGGTYALSLSYTAKSPGGLDLSNPANNVTSGSKAFSSGPLPAFSDGMMAFTGTPFAYNPALGNLLLTVQISGGIDSSPLLFLDEAQTQAQTGRAYFGTVTNGNDAGGLVTAFITTSISSPQEPIIAGQPTTFVFPTSNQMVQYPSNVVIPPGTTMVATATTMTTADFQNTRTGGSTFFQQNPNAKCIVYPDAPTSATGSCVIFEDKCFDINMNPITCPTSPQPNIIVSTTINNLPTTPASLEPLPVNPGFLTADDNQNDWVNIFLDMYVFQPMAAAAPTLAVARTNAAVRTSATVQPLPLAPTLTLTRAVTASVTSSDSAPGDPTVIRGGTTGFNSDFAAVDIGPDPLVGAGTFLGFQPPLTAKNARVFTLGTTIPVKFQVVSTTNASQFITNATAKLTVVLQANPPVQELVGAANKKGTDAQFVYDLKSNSYQYYLSTVGYPAGNYTLTVFSNSFPAQVVTFTLQ